jgi:hypothetical protein
MATGDDRLRGGCGKEISFVYGESPEGYDVPFAGGHSLDWSSLPPLPRHFQARRKYGSNVEYCSSAPLARVSAATVFFDKETELCLGILFQYENGGLRAVGQCRLGFDPYKKYAEPLTMCSRIVTLSKDGWRGNILGNRIEFGGWRPHEQHPEEDGWECRSLQGTLIFYFSPGGNTCIRVQVDEEP